jgi:hypothetical protein
MFYSRFLPADVHRDHVDPHCTPQLCTDQSPHGRRRLPAFDLQYHCKLGQMATVNANQCLNAQHMASDIKRLYSGLVHFRDTYPGGPPAWFANSNDPSFVFKNAVYGFQTVVGDGVAVRIFLICSLVSLTPSQIYRCYMVWRSIWIIIFPVIMWFAVCGK